MAEFLNFIFLSAYIAANNTSFFFAVSFLQLLVDGVAMLVPESQPFSFSLVAEKLPSAKTMSSALSTLATQTLLIRHNYVQSATPVVRTSSVEEPREGGEDSVLQEGIYMDMSAGVYGHVRTDSISSCGSKCCYLNSKFHSFSSHWTGKDGGGGGGKT